MSKYIVRDVVCDWGICSVDDLGKEELVEACNSKANAELICEILNTDLMKDGEYTIWKDKKISDLEAKLAVADDCSDRYWKQLGVVEDENEKLKQQLAEKERQVAEYSDINNALNSGLQERCISCEEEHNQDKISFAVEQLEKVKEKVENRNRGTRQGHSSVEYKDGYSGCCCEITDFIDNQIKAIKGDEVVCGFYGFI